MKDGAIETLDLGRSAILHVDQHGGKVAARLVRHRAKERMRLPLLERNALPAGHRDDLVGHALQDRPALLPVGKLTHRKTGDRAQCVKGAVDDQFLPDHELDVRCDEGVDASRLEQRAQRVELGVAPPVLGPEIGLPAPGIARLDPAGAQQLARQGGEAVKDAVCRERFPDQLDIAEPVLQGKQYRARPDERPRTGEGLAGLTVLHEHHDDVRRPGLRRVGGRPQPHCAFAPLPHHAQAGLADGPDVVFPGVEHPGFGIGPREMRSEQAAHGPRPHDDKSHQFGNSPGSQSTVCGT